MCGFKDEDLKVLDIDKSVDGCIERQKFGEDFKNVTICICHEDLCNCNEDKCGDTTENKDSSPAPEDKHNSAETLHHLWLYVLFCSILYAR